MPKVGDRHFAYTTQGKRKAKAYAKQVGKPVEMGKVAKGKPIRPMAGYAVMLPKPAKKKRK